MPPQDTSTEYWEIVSTAVPEVSRIRLYRKTVEHIEERHPEVVDTVGIEGVISAINAPTRVLESSTNPAQAFVFVSDTIKYESNPLHVPVKVVEGTSARVRTAYFVSGPSTSAVLWELRNAT